MTTEFSSQLYVIGLTLIIVAAGCSYVQLEEWIYKNKERRAYNRLRKNMKK